MEGDAAGVEPKLPGLVQHFDGHFRVAAELTREWPFRSGTVEKEPTEYLGTGRCARDLPYLGLAVDREEANTKRMRAGDITLLLDGIAEGDTIGCGTDREHHLDLCD